MSKIIFSCSYCDTQYPKWQGQCLSCGKWGTIEQEAVSKKQVEMNISSAKIIDLNKISGKSFPRISCGLDEVDRVLGGGIVAGSLVLLGGEPGIGKSTLVLQIAQCFLKKNLSKNILYISGEESAEQIKMRVDRLEMKVDGLNFASETDINIACATIQKEKPGLVIADSIQTFWDPEDGASAGSVGQVRLSTVKFLEQAKKNSIPIFIIGHVTKDGQVAGPKTLEHLVDTVLYLEGDQYHQYRILRSVKNRFGNIAEIGVFDMQSKGLIEIKNPSEIFLDDKNKQEVGSVITAVLEGTRAFLVEIQALVTKTVFGYPRRLANGFDLNRLQLLIAVLTKRCRLNLATADVHLNIAGGFKIKEPASDLAVCVAIISATKDRPIESGVLVLGEVGLGGELRSVSRLEQRIKEAEKLGFKKVIIPKSRVQFRSSLELMQVKNLNEVVEKLFDYSK